MYKPVNGLINCNNQFQEPSMSSKTSKQGTATINMSFEVGGVDALQQLINRLMAVNSVIDIERSNG